MYIIYNIYIYIYFSLSLSMGTVYTLQTAFLITQSAYARVTTCTFRHVVGHFHSTECTFRYITCVWASAKDRPHLLFDKSVE